MENCSFAWDIKQSKNAVGCWRVILIKLLNVYGFIISMKSELDSGFAWLTIGTPWKIRLFPRILFIMRLMSPITYWLSRLNPISSGVEHSSRWSSTLARFISSVVISKIMTCSSDGLFMMSNCNELASSSISDQNFLVVSLFGWHFFFESTNTRTEPYVSSSVIVKVVFVNHYFPSLEPSFLCFLMKFDVKVDGEMDEKLDDE